MIRQKKGGKIMLTCIYVVEKIDGDYAELRRVDALKHDQKKPRRWQEHCCREISWKEISFYMRICSTGSSSIKRIKYQREQIYQF